MPKSHVHNFDATPMEIGEPVTNGTTGSVLYVDANGNLGQDNANLNVTLSGSNVTRLNVPEIRAVGAAGLGLYDDGGSGIFVKDDGNVGIGTDAPAVRLHVVSSTNNHDLYLGNEPGSNQNVGMSGFPNNGNRRDIRFSDTGIELLTRNSSSAPVTGNGLTINEGGNVGIGTTAPEETLHIFSSGSNDAKIVIEGGAGDDETVNFKHNTGQQAVIGWDAGDSVLKLKTGTTMTGASGININSDNNVGIGVTSPNTLLHVKNDSADSIADFSLENDAQDWRLETQGGSSDQFVVRDETAGNNPLIIRKTAPTNTLFLEGTGNVGLGTSNPNAQLHTTEGRIINTTRVTGNTTLDATHHSVFCDTDGGAITITLPAGVDGTLYIIKNVGSSGNDVTLTPNGAETIDGAASGTLVDKESFILIYETTEGWSVV